ncbi:MAG: Glycogen synthase, partial [Candidatus Gottesmanbacteria bacterium GW2011_GWA2_42_18]
MKVLFAVWELPPFFKVGGLGDVARALPADLIMMGVDIAVVMPFYKAVRFGEINKKHIRTFHCIYNGKEEKVDIYKALHPLNNFPCFFLKNSIYLDVVIDQDTWPFFNKAIIEAIKGNFLSFTPDIIHCNDV